MGSSPARPAKNASVRLIATWRPSKSFIWVQVPAGVPKMFFKHLAEIDKSECAKCRREILITETKQFIHYRLYCKKCYHEEMASEAQIG